MTRVLRAGTVSFVVALLVTLKPASALAGDDPNAAQVAAEATADEAEALQESGEWRAASWKWTKAWETWPSEFSYGLEAGLASQEAGDCPKAKRMLDRFMASDAVDKRARKKGSAALAEIEAAACAVVDEEAALEDAKVLYTFAEGEAEAQNWETAMYAYEDAYFLVPAKVGFAFKVGKAAFEAKRCDKASEYLNHFDRYGDPEKHEALLAESEGMQNRLETLGCGDRDAPPPIAKKGCALDDSQGPGALMAFLALLFVRRRR